MTKNERLKLAREKSGLSQQELANKLPRNNAGNAVNQSYIAQLESKKGFSYNQAKEFAKVLNISADWLFFGNDNPLNQQSISNNHKTRLEAEPLYIASDPNDPFNDGAKFEHLGNGIIRMRIKVVPQKAQAGYLRGFQDPEYFEQFETVSIDVEKEHKGHYLSFEVAGDSMVPPDLSNTDYMALPGWKAIARELPHHHWQYKLHTHKVKNWIIVHQTEGILIKQIINHNVESGEITIHSLNHLYEDQVLNLRDIAQLFSVVKYIID